MVKSNNIDVLTGFTVLLIVIFLIIGVIMAKSNLMSNTIAFVMLAVFIALLLAVKGCVAHFNNKKHNTPQQ